MTEIEYYRVFPSWENFHVTTTRLIRRVCESGFHPDAIMGIWRGGVYVAGIARDVFEGYGLKFDDPTAEGKSYNPGIANQSSVVSIYNMEEVMKRLKAKRARRILPIDDIVDTGVTLHAFRHILRYGLRISDAIEPENNGMLNHTIYRFPMRAGAREYILRVPMTGDITPLADPDVHVAAPYYKPHALEASEGADFSIQPVEIDDRNRWPWVIFPWEIVKDGSPEEMREHHPGVYEALYGERRLISVPGEES